MREIQKNIIQIQLKKKKRSSNKEDYNEEEEENEEKGDIAEETADGEVDGMLVG